MSNPSGPNGTDSATASLQQRDRASLLHPFTMLKQFSSGEAGVPRIITGGHGIRIHDRDGRELIDATVIESSQFGFATEKATAMVLDL